jgi:hypothetical protein
MVDYDAAFEAAADEPAFGNGTEWDIWRARWCEKPCARDVDENCPLIMVALMERTPQEWVREPGSHPGDYRCTEFREVES